LESNAQQQEETSMRMSIRAVCTATLLVGGIVASSTAQTLPDRRTNFTFSGPVAVPGVTLPAGEYEFKLADTNGGSRIVQVMSADGTKAYATFFSIPAERAEISSKPEVRFIETSREMPTAIKTWWYPGERTGFELIYPKEQARRLARGAGEPVLTTKAETTTAEQTNTSELTRISPSGDESNIVADSAAPAREGNMPSRAAVEESRRAQADTNAPATTAPSQDQERRPVGTSGTMARNELPQTASPVPAVALAGVLALGAGVGLWGWRRKRAFSA
jgi:LPXTG-motif cell wall-anchored protein